MKHKNIRIDQFTREQEDDNINELLESNDTNNEIKEENDTVDNIIELTGLNEEESNEEEFNEEESNEIIEEVVAKEGKVSCDRLNVRSAANVDAGIVFVITKDSVVSILDDSDEFFYKISYNNKEGYCMKEFIELL